MGRPFGEKNTITRREFSVPNTDITIPAMIFCGKEAGQVITISAGIHSREYIGIEALIRLSQQLRPETLHGTVVLLLCCNFDGFIQRSSDCIPADGKNLNREFPGDSTGTVTQKIAAFLEATMIRRTDYLVDLHSGGFCESLVPHVYYHGSATAEVCVRSLEMAKLTSPVYLVRSTAENGFYSYAGQCGVPAILLERGGCGLLLEEEVQQDIADVKNILRGLGFLRDAMPQARRHVQIPFGYYVDAPCSGCWYPRKRPGDVISRGEVLGEIRTIYGDSLETVTAKGDAVLLYQTESLGIEKNKPMIAYGIIEAKQKENQNDGD